MRGEEVQCENDVVVTVCDDSEENDSGAIGEVHSGSTHTNYESGSAVATHNRRRGGCYYFLLAVTKVSARDR